MKRKNITKRDSKVFCFNSSLGSNFSDFKISKFKMFNLKVFNFLLIFALMLVLSLSVFSNRVFADETNSNAKQESVQNQKNNQNQKAAQDSNQANTQDAAQKQTLNQTIETVKGIKSPQKVMLNGRDVEISAYNISDENYFKLRDIAALVTDTNKSFDVFYNKEKNMIEITKNKKYQKIEGDLAPLADGKVEGVKSPQILEIDKKQEDVRAYNIMGNNYYRLRDLGEKLGLEVDYHASTNKISLISEHIPPKAVPKGEIKTEMYIDEDGAKIYRDIYPDEIMKEPMRTCYPRAPKGEIVYDILEREYFNDKGEPVNTRGERINSYRERMAQLFEVEPFELDLRYIETGDLGGEGLDWKSH